MRRFLIRHAFIIYHAGLVPYEDLWRQIAQLLTVHKSLKKSCFMLSSVFYAIVISSS